MSAAVTDAVARRWRVATVVTATALCVLFALWHLARFSTPTALLVTLLGCLPWAFVLPGLAAGRAQSGMKALLLTTPYLGYGLMEVLANPGARPWAAASVFLAFATAVGAIVLTRLSRPRTPASRG